ncbi:hypothetical protein H696_04681 [Fonticula alba]|uniref:Uncharacterized protein n=1 Tax=Fonticula alba TaxID=691883 RepID=A0A058Z4E5_FONAL|nr:hypothetical protein H696_04681 [Fonticula alba]KCV68392.1 hypothetical protein H696_04681 [Fonticula alba]|eukprot:XP_009496824.1 hypothetical protein H696_04681 [Fonticula alba]
MTTPRKRASQGGGGKVHSMKDAVLPTYVAWRLRAKAGMPPTGPFLLSNTNICPGIHPARGNGPSHIEPRWAPDEHPATASKDAPPPTKPVVPPPSRNLIDFSRRAGAYHTLQARVA